MRIRGEALGLLVALALLTLPGSAAAQWQTGASVDPNTVTLSTLSADQLRRVLPALKRIEDRAAVKYVNGNMEHPEEFEQAYLRRVEAEGLLFDHVAPAWFKWISIYGSQGSGSVARPPNRRSGPTGLQRSPRDPDRNEKAVTGKMRG
ncbi:MAG: hypothetical protein HY914_15615 [Desulfomonile tiedjei]|nr:hypothetical protein [Desulfomonile tiedjei]